MPPLLRTYIQASADFNGNNMRTYLEHLLLVCLLLNVRAYYNTNIYGNAQRDVPTAVNVYVTMILYCAYVLLCCTYDAQVRDVLYDCY